MDLALRAIADADDGPSLSRHLERARHARAGAASSLVHRSAYQLKEADPHSWAHPAPERPRRRRRWSRSRPTSTAAAAPSASTPTLFADAMDALGLDARLRRLPRPRSPACTLATVNLMSLFGLHRRLRGAIVGHLALFEMTSSIPNRRYAQRPAPARLRRRQATRLLRRARRRPTPCTRTSPRSTSPAASRARSPSCAAGHPLGRARAGRARGALGARTCSRLGDGAASLLRRAARGAGLDGLAPPRPARPAGRAEARRACACRRRTAGSATCRSGTARPSRARRRSRCRPGPAA